MIAGVEGEKSNGLSKAKEKIVYKNQKRKTRNQLIYLVGLHILLIFVFVGLICVEYLIPRDWGDSFPMSVISDVLFAAYVLEALTAIKFKNRKMLIVSIATLALSIGFKVGTLIMLWPSMGSLIIGHICFLTINSLVPWCLLLLWNKLNEEKWRQTFDLQTKLNNHLLKDEIALQN